jgi:hypothetical protein
MIRMALVRKREERAKQKHTNSGNSSINAQGI